jgi:hypothetical protein
VTLQQVMACLASVLAGGQGPPFRVPDLGWLVTGLVGAQEEQLTLLQGLAADAGLLAEGPWQIARLHLREATVPGRPPQHAAAALTRAADRFAAAVDQQPPGSFQRAQVLLDLAITQRLLGDSGLAASSAVSAYWLARRAMGELISGQLGGLPTQPEELARLTQAGAAYDAIEWAAGAVADPRAGRVVSVSGQRPVYEFGTGRVTWSAAGDLDFAYLAYFQLLLAQVRATEAVGPGPATSQRVLWLRFRDQAQAEKPRHPPLPPPALLADGRQALREVQLLATTGRL